MATSIEQAVKNQKQAQGVQPIAHATTHVVLPKPEPTTTPIANAVAESGDDAMDFVRANRIHVEHGSLFVDPYLVVHPRELDPTKEAALREKLQLTYSLNNPSFYEEPERVAIALNLGQLVPVSLDSKRSKLLDEVKKFNTQVDSGADAGLQQQADDKHAPFAAIVRDTVENPNVDPVGAEVLKNGLSIYLLIREKLTRNRFLNPLTDYVNRSNTPDQVLNDLADNIGVTPRDVREAALQGGVDAVGRLLGLDEKYVADVKQLAEHAATKDYGYNSIEHWHRGRQLNKDATLEQQLAAGMQSRIDAKISEMRTRVRHYYDAPEPIKAEEERIAREDMSVLEPIQRKLMFALGYEICHTPENTADNIAFHRGVYGLHRKAANDLSDIDGTYRIYYGGHGTRQGAVGTLAHEVAHNFWPAYFDKKDVAEIDRLADTDAQRFSRMQRLMDKDFDKFEKLLGAYHAADSAEKKDAVIWAANKEFEPYGIAVDGLFPYLVDAKSFRFMVWDANDVLSVEGGRYNRSGYDTPQERFREVISRFAEMRQVSQRDQPAVLQFLAPGLTDIWENHYIPHLERVYADVLAHKSGKTGVSGVQIASDAAPKVEVRTTPPAHGTPVGQAHAETSDAPKNAVLANSVALNPTTLAGLNALKGMGVSH